MSSSPFDAPYPAESQRRVSNEIVQQCLLGHLNSLPLFLLFSSKKKTESEHRVCRQRRESVVQALKTTTRIHVTWHPQIEVERRESRLKSLIL